MPHAGGGGHSGGFHSSSAHSSAPKYDKHGHLHSTYYIRPGYYYHQTYIPYKRKGRMRNVLAGPIVTGLMLFMFFLVFIIVISFDTGYSSSRHESYAIDKYYEVYDEDDKMFESNVLVNIVAYKENNAYDYIAIVGDDINISIDEMFGNEKTEFGKLVKNNIKSENYYDDLYSSLAVCLNSLNEKLISFGKYENNNTLNYKIVNESNLGSINGGNKLKEEILEFYDLTGYNISFVISNSEDIYGLEVVPLVIFIVLAIGSIIFSVAFGIRNYKAVKAIEEAEKNGDSKKYFEGEDDFETFVSENPQDDDDEYDWKKDF